MTKAIYLSTTIILSLLAIQLHGQCLIDPATIETKIKLIRYDSDKIFYLDSLVANVNQCIVKKTIKKDLTLARTYDALANQFDQLNKNKLALKLYLQSLKIRKNTLQPDNLLIARSNWNVGKALDKNNFHLEAINNYKTALKIFKRNQTEKDEKLLANIHKDLGKAQVKTNDYTNAIRNTLEAIDLFISTKDTLAAIYGLNDAGTLYKEVDKSDSTFILMDQAGALLNSYSDGKGEVDEERLAHLYINLGNASLENEKPELALKQYQIAYKLSKNKPSLQITCLTNIGNIYQRQDQYSAAFKSQNEALSTAQQFHQTSRHPQVLTIFNNIGDIYYAQKDYKSALRHYDLAIQQVFPAFQNQDHTKDMASITDTPLSSTSVELLNALNSRARTLLGLAQTAPYPLKTSPYVMSALQTCHIADQLIDQMRCELIGETTRMFWKKITRPVYQIAIKTAFILEDHEKVFYFMEKSKLAQLSDSQIDRQPESKAETSDEVLKEIQDLKETLKGGKVNRNTWKEIRGTLYQRIAALQQSHPAYFEFRYNLVVPDIPDVQQNLLNDSTAFVQYFVSDSIIYSILITKQEIRLRQKVYTKEDMADAKILSQLAKQGELFQSPEKERFIAINQHITKLIWESATLGINRYLIAPDNWLHNLNFEMLIVEPKDNPQWLIYKNSFIYAWSATMARFLNTERERAKGQFLGIAPVLFTDLAAMEHSEKEISGVLKLIEGESLIRIQTQRKNLQTQLAYNWRMIHWATHANSGAEAPYIALSDQNMELEGIYQFPMSQTELVTLSSCYFDGNWKESEGVSNLARAFMFSGSQSIVTSLWARNNESSGLLMYYFYENLTQGMDKDKALRQAKLTILKENPAPANWAPYLFYGNPTPMEGLKAPRVSWRSWLLGIVILVFGVLFYGLYLGRKEE